MSIEPGSVYGNRYTLTQRIAYGGMGEVWKASDKVLGRTVAIKLLSPNLAEQPGFQERFREEARHTALLGHHNIATVYDYGKEADGASWLVMEYVEGEPLSAVIAGEGPQSPRRTAMIIGQCADALQAAHEAGVVHRDVKPANILVRPDGVVKLTDFGIARAKDASPLTRTGEVMGTAQYISPEQAMGKPVTGASDIYSLGVVAYELLTGKRPFDEGAPFATAMAHVHKAPPPLPASMPSAMATVVASCLAKDPAQRPTSAAALAAAMRGGPAAAAAAVPAGFDPTKVMGGPTETTKLADPAAYAQTQRTTVAPVGASLDPDEPRRTNPWLWAVFALLALVALVAMLRITGVIGNDSPKPTTSSTAPTTTTKTTSPTTTTATTTTTTPTTTTTTASTTTTTTTKAADNIDPTIYVNSPRANVVAALQKLGYTKFTYDMVDNDKPAGTVLAVNPSGVVPFDQPITLKISNGPQQTPIPPSPGEPPAGRTATTP